VGGIEEDPLTQNLRGRPELGLLVLDPRRRQRVRANGRGLLRAAASQSDRFPRLARS
jgi:hypothetical protein